MVKFLMDAEFVMGLQVYRKDNIILLLASVSNVEFSSATRTHSARLQSDRLGNMFYSAAKVALLLHLVRCMS